MRKTTHTSIAVSLWGGILLMLTGLLVAKPLLILMGTPPEILPLSCTYIWICFAGIPFIMLYNFGCAILRALGDTRRPLYFLILAGIVNVLMNLFLVVVCKMDVEGVALATTLSHAISAILILWTLARIQSPFQLHWKELKIDLALLKEMLWIGIPAGLQGSCFAISNMTIQSAINSFGSLAMAGVTAALGLEGMVYVGSFAFHQTAISFTAQNLGAKKYNRIAKSLAICFCCAAVSCGLLGGFFYWAGEPLLSIFNPDEEVIQWGMVRMKILFTTYFLCGVMDVSSGGLRGLGYSLTASIISLLGACVFRVWWVKVIFPHYHSMENLMLSYPISWGMIALCGIITLIILYRRKLYLRYADKLNWSKNSFGFPRGYRYLVHPK